MAYKNFTLGDLRAMLAPLSNARKQAILYALDTHGTLDQTINLAWKQALRTQTSEFARDIVIAQPRHLRLDYVFWQYLETGQASPLFGLENDVREVTNGLDFRELQSLYDRMIWIDSKVEAEHFVRTLLMELL
jgi:hypothetical protein